MSSLAIFRPTPAIPAGALLAVKGKSQRTTEAYRGAVSRFVAWAATARPTAELFACYIAELKEAGRPASTVNQALYAGKAALLQAAQAEGMAARELAVMKAALDSIPALKPGPPGIRVLSAEERRAILGALNPRLALLARFLYVTACRVSEALSLRVQDVKEAPGSLAELRVLGKGRKERHVKCPAALLREILQVYDRPGRVWLFETMKGKRISRTYVTHAIAEAAQRAIGRQISAHDYRHSRLTDLYHSTGRLKAVSEYAGHASTSTTAAYYVRDELTDEELGEE
jgi:integrase